MLQWIGQRMRGQRIATSPSGGRDLTLVGDLGQLSHVVSATLYTPYEELTNRNQRHGRELWLAMQHVYNLTSHNRCDDDPKWYSALARLQKNGANLAGR
jgi:hypothetical protein